MPVEKMVAPTVRTEQLKVVPAAGMEQLKSEARGDTLPLSEKKSKREEATEIDVLGFNLPQHTLEPDQITRKKTQR